MDSVVVLVSTTSVRNRLCTWLSGRISTNSFGPFEAEQKIKETKIRNDRFIGVAKQSLLYADIARLADLNQAAVEQIEAFFVNYQEVRNVAVSILAHGGPERALQALRSAALQK